MEEKRYPILEEEENKKFVNDEIYGERLLISLQADKRELSSNIRAGRSRRSFRGLRLSELPLKP